MSITSEWAKIKTSLSNACDEIEAQHGRFATEGMAAIKSRNTNNLQAAIKTCGLKIPQTYCTRVIKNPDEYLKTCDSLYGRGNNGTELKELEQGTFMCPENFVLIDKENGNYIATDEDIEADSGYVLPLAKIVAIETDDHAPEPIEEAEIVCGWLGLKFDQRDICSIGFFDDWGYHANPVTLSPGSWWDLRIGQCAIFTSNDDFSDEGYLIQLAPKNLGISNGQAIGHNKGINTAGTTDDDTIEIYKPFGLSKDTKTQLTLYSSLDGFTYGCDAFLAEFDTFSDADYENLGLYMGKTVASYNVFDSVSDKLRTNGEILW